MDCPIFGDTEWPLLYGKEMSQNNQITAQMQPLDILILIVLSVLWGGSFFFFEVLLEYWQPLTIVTLRVAIAALVLWCVVLGRRVPMPKTGKAWMALLVVGILNNALPFFLIVWGQTHITAGMSSILNATTPFFTVVVAGALLADERITGLKLVGVVLGLIGTIVMIGPEVLLNGFRSGGVLGQLAVIGAAISYAFAGVWSRRFKEMGITPLVIAVGQTTMAAILLLPIALIVEAPLQTLSGASVEIWAAMIGLAVFSTALAYLLYFRLIATAGATNASLVTFLVPISAIILGVMFLAEPFTRPQAIGMALIGLGLVTMDGRLFKRFKRG